jgi:hypothetical protein
MKQHVWVIALLLAAVPAFGQDTDDALTAGAQFAIGNLAVRDYTRGPDPVQELTTFFRDIKLPLSRDQRTKLPPIFEAYRTELAANNAASVDVTRKLNLDYLKRVNDVLSPEQQAAWRHYRVDQIRLRGGYPALQAILESAGAPLSADQEKTMRQIFENFEVRRAQLTKANPTPAMVEVDKLAVAEFDRIVALLTQEQRKALQASRRSVASARR